MLAGWAPRVKGSRCFLPLVQQRPWLPVEPLAVVGSGAACSQVASVKDTASRPVRQARVSSTGSSKGKQHRRAQCAKPSSAMVWAGAHSHQCKHPGELGHGYGHFFEQPPTANP